MSEICRNYKRMGLENWIWNMVFTRGVIFRQMPRYNHMVSGANTAIIFRRVVLVGLKRKQYLVPGVAVKTMAKPSPLFRRKVQSKPPTWRTSPQSLTLLQCQLNWLDQTRHSNHHPTHLCRVHVFEECLTYL